MPTSTFQKLFLMFLTVLLSVIVFVIYNITINTGGFSNQVWLLTIKEVPLELLFAAGLQLAFANKLALKLAFKIVPPKNNKPFRVIIAITCISIFIMCPSMTFIATIIYDGFNYLFLANWLQKMAYNLPFAFAVQFLFIGPTVRLAFKLVFKKSAFAE